MNDLLGWPIRTRNLMTCFTFSCLNLHLCSRHNFHDCIQKEPKNREIKECVGELTEWMTRWSLDERVSLTVVVVTSTNKTRNNNCQWVLQIVLVAQVRSLVPQFTVNEFWCITNRYIRFESVDRGSTGVWCDYLLLSIKADSNYSNAI